MWCPCLFESFDNHLVMHGLIVFGPTGSVLFHTSPFSRDFVDNVIAITQGDLQMMVADMEVNAYASRRRKMAQQRSGRDKEDWSGALTNGSFSSVVAHSGAGSEAVFRASTLMGPAKQTASSSRQYKPAGPKFVSNKSTPEGGLTSLQQQQQTSASLGTLATAKCMETNFKRVCQGTVVLFPSEHAWLKHHTSTFVAVSRDDGQARRQPRAATPQADDGRTQGSSSTPSSARSSSRLDDVPNPFANYDGKSARPRKGSGSSGLGAVTPGSYLGNVATGGDSQEGVSSSADSCVLLYWRKVADRVIVLVLHEDESLAVARHVTSNFIVLLVEAFNTYHIRGSATAGAVSHTDSVAVSATHQALSRVEEMVHADSAFDQLPSLRDMLLRPELVQEVYSTVAPGHIPALIDTPIAKAAFHRHMSTLPGFALRK